MILKCDANELNFRIEHMRLYAAATLCLLTQPATPTNCSLCLFGSIGVHCACTHSLYSRLILPIPIQRQSIRISILLLPPPGLSPGAI